MRHLAEDVIREEHQALAAMLQSLSLLVVQARRDHVDPPFEVLRAMLLYVDEFPEQRHHPKETRLLFPKLRMRVPAIEPVLDRLEREHLDGEHAIRVLEHALLAYEVLGEPRRAAFERALHRYTHAYLEHMATEEREVLPLARRHLSEADWAELDAAFAENRDPLTGRHAPADEFGPLFHRIVMAAPAPIGLGQSK